MSTECSFHKNVRECDYTCFPCTFMHGVEGGKGGLWSTTGVPKSYRDCRIETLPIEASNPKAYKLVNQYIDRVLMFVREKNAGLFLFSVPETSNPFGTGTGKTTTAVTILNHYVIERARAFFKGAEQIQGNPAVFVKSTELQNTFNAQFRGSKDMQEKASAKYYRLKDVIKHTELVVLDDIATRGSRISEAYEEELYEMLDYRSTYSEGATIFTSNINMDELSKCLGERITSRIAGMTVKVGFKGSDNRLDGLFK